ncbi:choice-of-anchor I family protein [Paenibacillus sp. IB182496]|uniref:Choice-of-anchor I family protein n=1 Tax=Paenibacillus sabuli TaxID=2772509 RepID=A0A927GTC5_9BACL|nr:choice-of-anchor I family protein [Paenibacillus sabuli]MBD2847443.1 choice-of-anchor I family protein [Paenibacillus sabuli]
MKKLTGVLALSMGLTALTPLAGTAVAEPGDNAYAGTEELTVTKIAGYDTGAGLEESGAEIVTYDAATGKVYLINGATASIEIVDLAGLQHAVQGQELSVAESNKISIAAHSPEERPELFGDVTSVVVHPTADLMAAAVPNSEKTDNGSVVFFTKSGEFLDYVEVGALPDMITLTPDGRTFLVANEGEPNADYTVDPEGSVSMITWSEAAGAYSFAASTASFDDPSIVIDDNVRYASLLTGYVEEPTPAQWAADFEPEFIVVAENGAKAYVALQESNAIAVLDVAEGRFTNVHGLGYKNHMLPGNGLDPSDRDPEDDPQINIANYPVLGMYMPDGIALKTINGRAYLFTANEGDSRAYGPDEEIADELRFKDMMSDEGPEDGFVIALDAANYPGTTQEELDALDLAALSEDEYLGRLTITNSVSDSVYTEGGTTYVSGLYAYGARSFSIWDVEQLGTDQQQVYDSGDGFEQIVAQVMPDLFNSDHAENEKDNRSDNKGPEPEYVELGEIDGELYAFVGLERQSGIMVYNVTNPEAPAFVTYYNLRDVNESGAGDLGPEGLDFIPAEQSPTGEALLLAGNEVSGTLAVMEIVKDAPSFAVTGIADEAHYAVTREQGKVQMTVNEDVSGLVTFGASVSAIAGHEGNETVVFTLRRGGEQLALSAVRGDLDSGTLTPQAQFNVQAGDVVEVYVVDELTNDPERQPVVLQ